MEADATKAGKATIEPGSERGRRAAARHAIGSEIDVSLAPEACWAYLDSGPSDMAQ